MKRAIACSAVILSLMTSMICADTLTGRVVGISDGDTLTLQPPLANKVDQLAARLELSRGWVVKQALSAWVDQEEARSRLTREAMSEQVPRLMREFKKMCWRVIHPAPLMILIRC